MKRFSIVIVFLSMLSGCSGGYVGQLADDDFADIVANDGIFVPHFEELKNDFAHNFDDKSAFKLTDAALIDIDGDGFDEIFVGSGMGQNDFILKLDGNTLINIAHTTNLDTKNIATYAVVSKDVDNNGFFDLVVSRSDGVFRYLLQSDGTFFTNLMAGYLQPTAMTSHIAIDDVNADGLLDYYFSTRFDSTTFSNADVNNLPLTYNLLAYGTQGGSPATASYTGNVNVFHTSTESVFADFDKNGFGDLLLASLNEPLHLYYNNGDGTFTDLESFFELTGRHNWRSVATVDIDNDGDMDIFGVADDVWLMLRNDGELMFDDITEQMKLTAFAGGNRAIFADLNADELPDLLVVGNGLSRVLLLSPKGYFIPSEKQLGLSNSYNATGVAVGDINKDEHQDIVYANVNGPIRVFLGK